MKKIKIQMPKGVTLTWNGCSKIFVNRFSIDFEVGKKRIVVPLFNVNYIEIEDEVGGSK